MLSPWEPECHLQDMSVRRGPNNIASPLLLFCIWILGVPGFFRDCSLSFLTGPSKFRLAVVITAEYSVFFYGIHIFLLLVYSSKLVNSLLVVIQSNQLRIYQVVHFNDWNQ